MAGRCASTTATATDGALSAAAYCLVLSRRLRQFTQLESGMGGAIAVLSAQVDEMTRVLDTARVTATESAHTLETVTTRAEKSAQRIELLLASLHDLPDPASLGTARPRVLRKRRRDLEVAE